MKTVKGFCEVCGSEIDVHMCCSGRECGCMGLLVEPPVCSDECYDKLMSPSLIPKTGNIIPEK